jgi:hypothetical protein
VKSTEGSAWISFASSRIRRTPGDFVLRGIVVDTFFESGWSLCVCVVNLTGLTRWL